MMKKWILLIAGTVMFSGAVMADCGTCEKSCKEAGDKAACKAEAAKCEMKGAKDKASCDMTGMKDKAGCEMKGMKDKAACKTDAAKCDMKGAKDKASCEMKAASCSADEAQCETQEKSKKWWKFGFDK